MIVVICGFLGILIGCSNTQVRKPDSDLKVRNKKKQVETAAPEISPTESAPVQYSNLRDLREFVAIHQKTLESLGKKKEDGSYLVESSAIEGMKKQVSKLLQLDPNSMTFLLNPRSEGAWFGNCALILDKKQERLIMISNQGDEQNLSLRDKIFGGLYRTQQGQTIFLSAFYGDLQKKIPYRMFWGTQELKVISFSFDRSKEGTVEGQAKGLDGTLLSVFRKGRDNKSVQVNGQTLIPVFE